MRVDTHVHTFHSGNTSLYPLHYLLRESYNSPEGIGRIMPWLNGIDVRNGSRLPAQNRIASALVSAYRKVTA